MALSLTQAAKAAKISKSTLSVAIQKGRVSALHLPDGSYQIEPAELFRAFPPKADRTGTGGGVRSDAEPASNPTEPNKTNPGSPPALETSVEVAVLKAKLEAVEVQLERERETVEDLRRRLDAEQEERRALQRQLMPPEKPREPELVEELRKRVEEAEGRIAALVVSEKTQERPMEVVDRERAAKAPKGLLSRLIGW